MLKILCGRLFKVKFTSKAGENFLIWSNRLIYFIAKIEVFNGIFAVLTDPLSKQDVFVKEKSLPDLPLTVAWRLGVCQLYCLDLEVNSL